MRPAPDAETDIRVGERQPVGDHCGDQLVTRPDRKGGRLRRELDVAFDLDAAGNDVGRPDAAVVCRVRGAGVACDREWQEVGGPLVEGLVYGAAPVGEVLI